MQERLSIRSWQRKTSNKKRSSIGVDERLQTKPETGVYHHEHRKKRGLSDGQVYSKAEVVEGAKAQTAPIS